MLKKFPLILSLVLSFLIGAGPSPTDRQYSTEKNLLINPGFENNIAAWTNSSGTFAHTTTAAQVGSGRGAASFDASATSQYMESAAYAIPERMVNHICTASIWYKGGDSNLTLKVIDGSGTTLNSVALVASTNYLQSPALDFTCGDATTDTVKIRIESTANAAVVYVDDAFIGTGERVPVAATGYLGSIGAITVVNNGSKVFTISHKSWRRDNMLILKFSAYGSAAASADVSGDTFALVLPAGYTIDASALPNPSVISSGENTLGFVQTYGFLTSTTRDRATRVTPVTTSRLQFIKEGSSTVYKDADLNIANEVYFDGELQIPISEWAGSPNYAASNSPEFASVGGTWNADSTTTVYGQSGSLMGGALSAARQKTITWQTPVQANERIQIWGSEDQVNWFPIVGARMGTTGYVVNLVNDAGDMISGVQWLKGASANQTIVRFAQYMSYSTDGAPTTDWPSSLAYWVATKSRSDAFISFGAASQSRLGLIKAGQTPGTNTNDSPATGYVGEIISNSGAGVPTAASTTTAASSGSYVGIASGSLTAGEWDVSVVCTLRSGGGTFTANSSSACGVGTTAASATGTVDYYSLIFQVANASVTTAGQPAAVFVLPSVRFSFASATTIYVNGNAAYSSTAPTWAATFLARRVR